MLGKISCNGAGFLPRRVRVYTATLGYPDHQPPVPPKKEVARKTRQTSFSVGCYCADEQRYHRSVLRELLAARGATLA